MTLHTKAATDEIYDLFSQPLKKAGEEDEEEEEEEDDEDESDDDDGDMTDGDYTSGGESTTTGRLVATSEVGDDETSDVRSVSEWSEFTARKHIPDLDNTGEYTQTSQLTEGTESTEDKSRVTEVESLAQDTEAENNQAEQQDEDEEALTPVELPSNARSIFVPIPPEDYVPATRPYRDPAQVSQNRLPFMTPIAEKTESSLGVDTGRDERREFDMRTPSKVGGSLESPLPHSANEDLTSSPLQETADEKLPEKIPQPFLKKGVKASTIATGTAKAPIITGPLAKEIPQKGPIIKDIQCNPVDDYVRNTILDNLQPPLSTYEGFHSHIDETRNQAPEIKKFTRAVAKVAKSSDKTAANVPDTPVLRFPGTEREYVLKRELGAGAFAPVYLLESQVEKEDEHSENKPAVMGKGIFDHLGRKNLEALKMEDPPSTWEFYIIRQAKRRLGVSRAAESIINAYEMHLYKDECYLIEEYRDQGTLLDIINIARADSTAAGGVMDESLVIFFTIELFRTMEALHAKGLLHGDLKADNCLVRLDPIGDEQVWSSKYRRDGTGGWNKKGVTLIDFGRGIDMKVFRPDVQFIADWKTSPQDCAEMRELRPWTYQIDYHGLAGIIHSMLFGKYIDTVADKGNGIGAAAKKSWKVKEALKRYWQVDIWNSVFDLLLNPGMHVEGEEGTKLPILKGMKTVRESMEAWLEANSEKGLGLQANIRKLECSLQSRRK